MKITYLKITNFRGIKNVELSDLGTMVVIAGQNGSGKSCIFDAIRLLKSCYGGYQVNELDQWMSEFQVSIGNEFNPSKSFNDRTKPLEIECHLQLSQDEIDFLKRDCDQIMREKVLKERFPHLQSLTGSQFELQALQQGYDENEIKNILNTLKENLSKELSAEHIIGKVIIDKSRKIQIHYSFALPIIFGTYKPNVLGIIDYHGPQRNYSKEYIQGINLNLSSNEQQKAQSALYNITNKYNNVKSELAASYIKSLISKESGVDNKSNLASLDETLKELFITFFPNKKYLGAQPTVDGNLSFQVEIGSGSIHDLDDLSAGEKEILYGYLRIRNSSPKNSIILLDEPELHLNPKLVKGLPGFYRKHLGESCNNQIWLITHSDALIREVVNNPGYNSFHMTPFYLLNDEITNQAQPIISSDDTEGLIMDLVGDLASYNPNSKCIILEGGGDSEFDSNMVSTLFPEINKEQINLISGTDYNKVESLRGLLDKSKIGGKYYSITDKDTGKIKDGKNNNYSWDVYHIENYLLEAKYIKEAIESINLKKSTITIKEIDDTLKNIAETIVEHHIIIHINNYVNSCLKKNIPTISSKDETISGTDTVLINKIRDSQVTYSNTYSQELSEEGINKKIKECRELYKGYLLTDQWKKEFMGKEILRKAIHRFGNGAKYDHVRNIIIDKMKNDGFQPPGMKKVIESIIGKK